MSSELNPKQERFTQLYVETGNASEAYRQAYNSKAKPEVVNVKACELLKTGKISVRVRQLREELEELSLWSRLDSVRVLANIAKGVDPDSKPSDKVNAVKALNAMHGWDAPSRVDVTTKGESLNTNLAERLSGGSKE